MIKYMPISETRKKIMKLAADMAADDTVSVTNRGKEVLAIIPWETYEAIAETLEILSDPSLMASLEQGLKDLCDGKLVDLEEAKHTFEIV